MRPSNLPKLGFMAITMLCGAGLTAWTSPSLAQNHPVMSNVVPDGGTGSIRGKVQSVDPIARKITIAPKDASAETFFVSPEVRLDDIETGDRVDAQFYRQVFWVVNAAAMPVPSGATHTVGAVARTPGGIGPEATQISGRVLKVDADAHTFDVVDATGGGVYTIAVTDPRRYPMLDHLHAGAGITVSLSPLTITALVTCGWFGCG